MTTDQSVGTIESVPAPRTARAIKAASVSVASVLPPPPSKGGAGGLLTEGAGTLTEPILDAAERVALRDGVGRVTLEAVSKEAGLSKSGLIHHYPSKDALLSALVRRKVEDWWAHCSAAMDQQPPSRGAASRGLIKACFECPDAQAEDGDDSRRRGCVVLAALIHDASHIEPVRATMGKIQARLKADGLPPGVTDLVRLALDGLWFNVVLGLGDLSDKRMTDLRSALEGLTRTGAEGNRSGRAVPFTRSGTRKRVKQ